jgi:hypothetical protein
VPTGLQPFCNLALLCTVFLVGEPEAQLPFGQEAVERARRLSDDVLLGRSLMLYLTSIDPARSLPLYPEAFACAERSGDHLINYFVHNNAGCGALEMGDIPAARVHLEAAAEPGSGSDTRTRP